MYEKGCRGLPAVALAGSGVRTVAAGEVSGTEGGLCRMHLNETSRKRRKFPATCPNVKNPVGQIFREAAVTVNTSM
jgi:hypothetical protein